MNERETAVDLSKIAIQLTPTLGLHQAREQTLEVYAEMLAKVRSFKQDDAEPQRAETVDI